MRRKKKKVKVRQFWPKNPVTQVHKDEKNDYNRSKDKLDLEKELEDDLLEDDEYDRAFVDYED